MCFCVVVLLLPVLLSDHSSFRALDPEPLKPQSLGFGVLLKTHLWLELRTSAFGTPKTRESYILIPRPKTRGIQETALCRMIAFPWSFGPLTFASGAPLTPASSEQERSLSRRHVLRDAAGDIPAGHLAPSFPQAFYEFVLSGTQPLRD